MNIKSICSRTIRKCKSSFIYHKVNSVIGDYCEKILQENPQKHARIEMRREKQHLLRHVDIENPIYFNEKLLWLKYNYYNHSKLAAISFNKYEVRKYVEKKGLSYILNDLIGVWDSVDDIPWDSLPDEYVIKVSNGCAGHVFKRKNEYFSLKDAKKTLNNTIKRSSYCFKQSGALYCYGTKQVLICEKLLHSGNDSVAPADYKFHCFNGKPVFLEYMEDRVIHKFSSTIVDMDLKDRHELDGYAKSGKVDIPECFEDMKKIAAILSQDFPYARIDLYAIENKPIFGEITLDPYHCQTPESLREMGDLIDLSKMDSDYSKLLRERI